VPVRWKVTHRASGESVIVVERLWVDARTAGSRAMGCDKNEVNCTRAEETSE
jgi:hypothetical protein